MSSEGGKRVPETEQAAEFTRMLADLKERGSNLLLVGSVNGMVLSQACTRFLGEALDEPRRRLFVSTDDSSTVSEKIQTQYGHADSNSFKLIRWETETRSSAAQSTSGRTVIPDVRIESDKLGTLGDEIETIISEFERTNDGFEPAELRLCFDSLLPVVAEYEPVDVFRFLHLLTGRIRTASGMAHYHLPLDIDDELVQLIVPLFDGIVEIRAENGHPEQRWHFPDNEFTTDWLSL